MNEKEKKDGGRISKRVPGECREPPPEKQPPSPLYVTIKPIKMNKFILLFIVNILLHSYSFGQTKELPLKLEIKLVNEYKKTFDSKVIKRMYPYDYFVTSGDSAIQKYYDIEIIISNDSPDTVYIWMMSCSWIDNFMINNDYMFLDSMDCDSNYLKSYGINPHDKKILTTTLRKDIKFDYPGNAIYGSGVTTTRLGLLVINDIVQKKVDSENYDLGMNDKSKWNIVWSNPLFLQTFKPKFIPIGNDK